MKFVPTKKENWVKCSLLPYPQEELEMIYDCLVKEMNQAMIILATLGGRIDGKSELPIPKLDFNRREFSSVHDAPDHLVGRLFKQIVADYEKKLFDFNDGDKMPQINVEDLIIRLQVHGMEMCVLQFYYFAEALERGRKNTGLGDDVDGFLAAFQVSHELGVPLKDLTIEKAVEYLKKKNEKFK